MKAEREALSWRFQAKAVVHVMCVLQAAARFLLLEASRVESSWFRGALHQQKIYLVALSESWDLDVHRGRESTLSAGYECSHCGSDQRSTKTCVL